MGGSVRLRFFEQCGYGFQGECGYGFCLGAFELHRHGMVWGFSGGEGLGCNRFGPFVLSARFKVMAYRCLLVVIGRNFRFYTAWASSLGDLVDCFG